jgi:hypothetical protein
MDILLCREQEAFVDRSVFEHSLRKSFAHRGRMFETMAGSASQEPDIFEIRVAIDEEVAVGRVLVLANFAGHNGCTA